VAIPLQESTRAPHIMKPQQPLEDTVINEGFCLVLAKGLGLHVVSTAESQPKREGLYL